MTNATVEGVTASAPNNGTLESHLSRRHSGCGRQAAADMRIAAGSTGCTGDAEIVVAPASRVIGLMLGDETLGLVPGAAVSLIATTTPEGTLQATRLTVEKDGVKPIL